jgi:hypothetical protein
VAACLRGKACRRWRWRHAAWQGLPPLAVAACLRGKGAGIGGGGMPPFYPIPFSKNRTQQWNRSVPPNSRTEHRVGTIPCPRNGTIPFRSSKFQNRTHPKPPHLGKAPKLLAQGRDLHLLSTAGPAPLLRLPSPATPARLAFDRPSALCGALRTL